jgi:membrane dipeptidase
MSKTYNIVDCHCDTLIKVIDTDQSMYLSPTNHIDFSSLRDNNVILQFFAAWPDPNAYKGRMFQRAAALIDKLYRETEKHSSIISVVTNFDQIRDNINNNKLSALIAVEGGDVLEGDLALLRTLYRLGVRSITLTWNGRNEIADGVGVGENSGGLTSFGKSVIEEMNSLGMIIDVSHLSPKGFWDVIELTKQPIIASHSNSLSICNHRRNLSDEQIKAIAKNGGIIGITFASGFLATSTEGIDHVVKHIDHMCSLVGADYVSLGSDFDGATIPSDIKGASCYHDIIKQLHKLNYSNNDINKIMGENILRIIRQVLK